MEFPPIILEGFNGREEALAQIKRYIHDITPIMLYRTNDLTHSRRVSWHLEEAIPKILIVYGSDFDVKFARTLALVHDDLEILSGDVQLIEKEQMNNAELNALAKKEAELIPQLVAMFNNTANRFNYAELLTAAKEKKRLEAQFVSFFDKFDGAGESWHEIWAGNHYFLLPGSGHNFQNGGYVRRLNEFPTKYPAMAEFFQQFPQYLPTPFDFSSVAEQGQPHTENSLKKDTSYLPYERWKKTIIKHEGIELLVRQIEFQ